MEEEDELCRKRRPERGRRMKEGENWKRLKERKRGGLEEDEGRR